MQCTFRRCLICFVLFREEMVSLSEWDPWRNPLSNAFKGKLYSHWLEEMTVLKDFSSRADV